MKHFLRLCTVTLLIAGCCHQPPKSPEYILYYLNRGFNNHPVNEFFAQYGFATDEYQSRQGGNVYRWVSTAPTNKNPVAANLHTDQHTNFDYQSVDNFQGVIERQYCELRIYTDAADTIQRFAITVDSIGKWSTSRCSEIFDRTYP